MDVWRRFGRARVARLGTVAVAERAQLVPCCFALDEGPVAYSAVDDKPKRSARLQRLANVAAHPTATLLVDHYDEDWTTLWWIRASGPAFVLDGGAEHDRAIAVLLAKYEQYFTHALNGPVLAIQLTSWRAWSAS